MPRLRWAVLRVIVLRDGLGVHRERLLVLAQRLEAPGARDGGGCGEPPRRGRRLGLGGGARVLGAAEAALGVARLTVREERDGDGHADEQQGHQRERRAVTRARPVSCVDTASSRTSALTARSRRSTAPGEEIPTALKMASLAARSLSVFIVSAWNMRSQSSSSLSLAPSTSTGMIRTGVPDASLALASSSSARTPAPSGSPPGSTSSTKVEALLVACSMVSMKGAPAAIDRESRNVLQLAERCRASASA